MKGITVILPAYKEAENLKNILPRLKECLSGIEHEILVVDSKTALDDTKEVCLENGCTHLPRTGGEFYGDAIRTGFASAQMEYTVVMDADGSHNPADILRFYDEMEKGQCDLVIGSRYCKGGNTANPWILIAMSRILNCAYKWVFKLPVEDVSDSFRMYKTDMIQKLNLSCQNFDIVEEILILLNIYNQGMRVVELPIIFEKRVEGESKRDLLKFVFSYITTMRTLLKIQKQAKIDMKGNKE